MIMIRIGSAFDMGDDTPQMGKGTESTGRDFGALDHRHYLSKIRRLQESLM
jgi:hypothetical protein